MLDHQPVIRNSIYILHSTQFLVALSRNRTRMGVNSIRRTNNMCSKSLLRFFVLLCRLDDRASLKISDHREVSKFHELALKFLEGGHDVVFIADGGFREFGGSCVLLTFLGEGDSGVDCLDFVLYDPSDFCI